MHARSSSHNFGSLRVRPPLAMAGQRIGVMGGSFNPPHAGHLIVARTALRRLGLDQLWWVVTPGNPLKANSALPSQAERMAACRALIGHDPRMPVTGFEAELGGPYTAVTLGFLARRYPAGRFVWVMGADNLTSFGRWQNWRGIARMMPIAIVDRPGWRFKALAGPAARVLDRCRLPEAAAPRLPFCRPPAWMFLTSRLSSLSSTVLRAGKRPSSAARPTARH